VSAAEPRSTEVLAVEVDALHAWLAAAVAAIVADRQARGLPVPAGLHNPAACEPQPAPAGHGRPRTRRHLSLVSTR